MGWHCKGAAGDASLFRPTPVRSACSTPLRARRRAGHGVGSTLTQRQAMTADIQAFLLWQMGKAGLKD